MAKGGFTDSAQKVAKGTSVSAAAEKEHAEPASNAKNVTFTPSGKKVAEGTKTKGF